MSHREGPKPWKVYDGDRFLAGCWTGQGAATTAYLHAKVRFQRDEAADTRIVCTESGDELHVGPHTPIEEVDRWIGEQESAYLQRWLRTSFTVPRNGHVH